MTEGKIYPQKMDPNDPLFLLKSTINDSVNYLHDNARDDKDRMYSKIYFSTSLLLTIFAAFFVEYLNLISILILANLLAVLLIIFGNVYAGRRKRFWENRNIMKKTFEDLDLEWRD